MSSNGIYNNLFAALSAILGYTYNLIGGIYI